MTFLMKLALEQLDAEPLDTQKLWAARIINGLRGCPNGLESDAFVPEDWDEGDEIFEALLATTADDLRAAMEAAEAEAGGESMPLETFLDQEAARDGAAQRSAAKDGETGDAGPSIPGAAGETANEAARRVPAGAAA